MDIRDAINYLRPIADNATNPGYAAALDTAIRSMEKVEWMEKELSMWEDKYAAEYERAKKAEAELRDERDRFDKLSDF